MATCLPQKLETLFTVLMTASSGLLQSSWFCLVSLRRMSLLGRQSGTEGSGPGAILKMPNASAHPHPEMVTSLPPKNTQIPIQSPHDCLPWTNIVLLIALGNLLTTPLLKLSQPEIPSANQHPKQQHISTTTHTCPSDNKVSHMSLHCLADKTTHNTRFLTCKWSTTLQ